MNSPQCWLKRLELKRLRVVICPYIRLTAILLVFQHLILAFPSSALAAISTADLTTAISNVVATIVAVSGPFCFVIGIFMIFSGLKRLADGNSSPHGGKGGAGKIIAGACLMQIGVVYGVLKATIQPLLDLLGSTGAVASGTANTDVTNAVNKTVGYIIGAIMGIAFLTGIVYVGKGIFMLSHSEGGGKNSAWDGWKHIIIGSLLLSFGVALGVAKTTIAKSGS